MQLLAHVGSVPVGLDLKQLRIEVHAHARAYTEIWIDLDPDQLAVLHGSLRSSQHEIDRRRYATPENARIPPYFARQVHFREASEHLVESDLHLHPRQRRAEAKMDTMAEGEVRIGATRDVENFG